MHAAPLHRRREGKRMRKAMPWLLALVAVVSLGCESEEGGADTRACTEAACEVLLGKCKLFPEGLSPSCFQAPDFAPGMEIAACARACKELGHGRGLACVLENVDLCEQANACGDDVHCEDSFRNEVLEVCGYHDPAPNQACTGACGDALNECLAGCPRGAWAACNSCSLTCFKAFDSCNEACPED
jgi:hypothetical protein